MDIKKYTILRACMHCAKGWGVPDSRLRNCTIELYRNWNIRGSVGAIDIISRYGTTWREFVRDVLLGQNHGQVFQKTGEGD